MSDMNAFKTCHYSILSICEASLWDLHWANEIIQLKSRWWHHHPSPGAQDSRLSHALREEGVAYCLSLINHSDTSQSWPSVSLCMWKRVVWGILKIVKWPIMMVYEQQFLEGVCVGLCLPWMLGIVWKWSTAWWVRIGHDYIVEKKEQKKKKPPCTELKQGLIPFIL